MRKTHTLVLLAVLSTINMVGASLAATPEIVLSAYSRLTGDPDIDFVVDVEDGQPFTLYVHVAHVDEDVRAWELGLDIRDAATVSIEEVRADGQSWFDQNSIGTFGVAKSSLEECVEIDGVLAEITFRMHSSIETEITLTSVYDAPSGMPQYQSCEGSYVQFARGSTPIRIFGQANVATGSTAWSVVKTRF